MGPLLALLFSLQTLAADPVNTAIEQAQSLTLKKNRQQATATLQKAIEAAGVPSRSRIKMVEAQNNIAKIFFTDKGQKLFESGQSIMYETPEVAQAQFREALLLEDGNVLVLANIARLQLAKHDCDGALATLQPARVMAPSAAEPAVLELRTLICQQKFELLREKLKTLPPMDKSQEFFVQYMTAQDYMQLKLSRRAFDTLIKLSEADAKFPEVYFHLTKIGAELGRDTEAYAHKYVSLCKALTPRDRKRYNFEPVLCSGLKEVEDELVKKNNEI